MPSQQGGASAAKATPTRKFAPVPVETSSRSSRKSQRKKEEESASANTKNTTGSSPDNAADSPPKPRRFLPEPVETSSKSSRRKPGRTDDHPNESTQSRGKFLPEPVESSPRRRGGRKSRRIDDDEDEQMPDAPSRQSSATSTSSATRKFSPELVETLRGSYRKRNIDQSSPETSRSPTVVGDHETSQKSPTSAKAPAIANIHESRFSAASLARRQEKRHSFIIPDLPSIPSNSSEESGHDSSGSTSPSALSAELASRRPTGKTRRSSDEHMEKYILDLAARVAERQLREQAMAAFPNEHDYHPVDHYAREEDSETSSVAGMFSTQGNIHVSKFRRDSGADLNFELSVMREHHDERERAGRELKAKANGESRFSAAALAANQSNAAKKEVDSPAKVVSQWQKGVGLTQMRNAASPPMLGNDIIFPYSVSPKMTRCDVDQAPVPRTEDSDRDEEMEDQQLWTHSIGVQNDQDHGLWMGMCHRTTNTPNHPDHARRSGLMTPAVEGDDPFNMPHGKDSVLGMHQLPLTPAISRTDPEVDSINRMLGVEEEIGKEFDNGFVTQIYNYLSLGYPSLAHPFDHELSKISRMSVAELRKDDQRTDAKGHVGAPEGNGVDESEVIEGKCARWTALRMYIQEWARQQPRMVDRGPDNWGARARRGSWAI